GQAEGLTQSNRTGADIDRRRQIAGLTEGWRDEHRQTGRDRHERNADRRKGRQTRTCTDRWTQTDR
ncbi:hypothetical protein V3C99_000169, partial [Haemonchus contortus]